MSLPAVLEVVCLALFGTLLVAAAAKDLQAMQIPNAFSLAIAALFAIDAAAGLASGQISISAVGMALVCGAAVFAVGAAAFAAGALGGGDVKLLAAVSLFAGPAALFDFLTITALAGGLIAVAVLTGAPIGRPAASGGSLRARLRGGIPYGPAICAGGLWVAASPGLN